MKKIFKINNINNLKINSKLQLIMILGIKIKIITEIIIN